MQEMMSCYVIASYVIAVGEPLTIATPSLRGQYLASSLAGPQCPAWSLSLHDHSGGIHSRTRWGLVRHVMHPSARVPTNYKQARSKRGLSRDLRRRS